VVCEAHCDLSTLQDQFGIAKAIIFLFREVFSHFIRAFFSNVGILHSWGDSIAHKKIIIFFLNVLE